MPMTCLVINTGSSNTKCSVFAPDLTLQLGRRVILAPGVQPLAAFLDEIERGGAAPAAVGHRVVHGGARFTAPCVVEASVLDELRALVPRAPLHQPRCIAAIEQIAARWPQVPQVACFDTAFHATQAPLARSYALPRALTDAGVRRYGFHGLSYESIASALPDFLGAAANGRVIVAHLGGGASLCALHERRSVATTMGFTPLDGLMMGTRCGALDPGVVLYLLRERGMSVEQVEQLLYRESGLLGVSGVSADMRQLLRSDQPHAREAVEMFVQRAACEIASLATVLQGLDALVFTGGIGEHAAEIRARVGEQLRWLGVHLDAAANGRHGPRISMPDSPVSAWVVAAREDETIARHTLRLLRSFPDSAIPPG